ncbi:ABC transporter ATP-binding protein [Bacteriovoracaceae bacterium]|nr:ABC transporter ATP-binding protein [Bacteriovoracaceae bacterium]
MKDTNLVTIDNIEKDFLHFRNPFLQIFQLFFPVSRRFYTSKNVLDNINIQIKKGESLGILGINGSGKSTLLKIITGIYQPTKGTLTVNGTISALIELGSGFNPNLTGRENLFFSNNLIGGDVDEFNNKIDKIIEFADIGSSIDHSISTYSTGMLVRLAFSLAIHVDPDLLIIDEALGVGDLGFQIKSFNRIKELREKGTTIILVTHSLDLLIKHCNRGIVLHDSKIFLDGKIKEAVDAYKRLSCFSENPSSNVSSNISQLNQHLNFRSDCTHYGRLDAKITNIDITNSRGKTTQVLFFDEEFTTTLTVHFSSQVKDPIFAFTIKESSGLEISGTNTAYENFAPRVYSKSEIVQISFKQQINIRPGKYTFSYGIVSFSDGKLIAHHRLFDVLYIEVVATKQFVGMFDLKSQLTIKSIEKH